jgi:hypothetical protein
MMQQTIPARDAQQFNGPSMDQPVFISWSIISIGPYIDNLFATT